MNSRGVNASMGNSHSVMSSDSNHTLKLTSPLQKSSTVFSYGNVATKRRKKILQSISVAKNLPCRESAYWFYCDFLLKREKVMNF